MGVARATVPLPLPLAATAAAAASEAHRRCLKTGRGKQTENGEACHRTEQVSEQAGCERQTDGCYCLSVSGGRWRQLVRRSDEGS